MKDNGLIKVLFIVPSLVRAGAETQLVDLVNGLSNQQFEKHLFTFEKNLDQKDRLDLENITLYNQPRRYKFDTAPIKRIVQIIDIEEIDVIHCTMQFPLLLAWLAKLQSRRKPSVISAIHSMYFHSLKYKLKDRLLYHYLLQSCSDEIIFVCQAQQQYWIKKNPSLSQHSHVIYNGIDAEHFNPTQWSEKADALRQRLKIASHTPVVACIAGFRPEKGHLILLDAIASLDHKPCLVLAGDGPLRSSIQRCISENNLENHVKLLGNVEDIRPLLAMSNLTVLPSIVETFSMAILESMCMGVPVLATDVGGAREVIIPSRTGFLVKTEDKFALTQGLKTALKDLKQLKEIGKIGRRLVLDKFEKKVMVSMTGDILKATAKTS